MTAINKDQREREAASLRPRSDAFSSFDDLARHLSRQFALQERVLTEVRWELADWKKQTEAKRKALISAGLLRG
ncbi:MAG: hypothetical protein AMXMBFR13_17930 [Phycisphaerae bacterium]